MTEPHPARLAVFFPALLFGWLRARTGGIGASVVFHALCNLFSATLARGYAVVHRQDRVVSSIADVSTGDSLVVKVADGGFSAQVAGAGTRRARRVFPACCAAWSAWRSPWRPALRSAARPRPRMPHGRRSLFR